MITGERSAAVPRTDEGDDELRFGRFRALPRRRQLLLGDEPIALSSRAFDILMVLIQARGALVTKDEILSRVWPGILVEENNLTVHIAGLRKVLGPDKQLIQTVFGRGYRFIGTVTCVTADAVPAATLVTVPATAAPSARTAERRQLSVLFCDLVGSTALASRLDPEDLCEVIHAYQDACVDAVTRFEGHITKYLGDGVLACFGWPTAHEDDAERAVRAALAAVAAVGALVSADGAPLAARAGIATGLVVVGDLIGERAARDEIVVGETPNLAARLQELAEPGSVVIAEGTRRLLGDLFVYRSLGPARLKGFAAPVPAYHVVGEGAAESRFEALHAAKLTPLVGRDHEVALLLERWERAREGEGQVVLLSGEPGIGKSRAVRALRETLCNELYTSLSHFCSPYHVNSALYPVIGMLERAARFERDDPPPTKLDKLEALLAQLAKNRDEASSLLAALLTIPTGDRYPPLNLTSEGQKQRTLEVLVDGLVSLAAKQPLLAVYEDVHWIDPSTLEFLGLFIERAHHLPVLVIITFRPEFVPPWAGYAHITSLMLGRLARRQGACLIEAVAGGKALPKEVLDQIITKADGVPLFIEELTKTLLESGLLREARDRYVLTGALPPLAIPATLHDSLLARLDRLGPAKQTAQLGAVLGREFSYELLAAVSQLPESELQNALSQLTCAELIFRRGRPPNAIYTFKHALVQDAAYARLLKSQRQQLHSRIAQVFKERFPDRAVTEPELLAHHHTEAGEAEQAIDYWLAAGRRATERSANAEAVAHLRRGLELLDELPDGIERARRELALQIALGTPLQVAKGYSAPETGTTYARARELCKRIGETAQSFPILFGQWGFHLVRAELERAHELAMEFLCQAQQQEDAVPLLMGHRVVGTSAFFFGQFAAARAHLEQVLAFYDPAQHRTLASLYAFNPRVTSLGYLSCVLFALGYPDQAVTRNREALKEAHQLSHFNTMAQALFFDCAFHQFLRARQTVRDRAEELMSLSREQGFPLYLAHGTIFHDWARAEEQQPEVGSAPLGEGLAAWKATGAEYILPYFIALSAEISESIEQKEEELTEALARVERTGERWFEPELYRLKGEFLRSNPDPYYAEVQAEACFHRALVVARGQSAKMWELRSAVSLACLRRDQGKRMEALDCLVPIYGWFTEGFDTPDLKEAEALLKELTH